MSHTTEENQEDYYLFVCLFIYCGNSGFRREVDKNCTLLGHYAASRGNFLPTFLETIFRSHLQGVKNPPPQNRDFGFLTPENGTDKLSRNVGKKFSLLTA